MPISFGFNNFGAARISRSLRKDGDFRGFAHKLKKTTFIAREGCLCVNATNKRKPLRTQHLRTRNSLHAGAPASSVIEFMRKAS